uniref:ATP-dependent RNA helicase n=1 Tax=Ditylenchus dipsaci TaxID=166011 RepID=A0A915DNI8_9BILA
MQSFDRIYKQLKLGVRPVAHDTDNNADKYKSSLPVRLLPNPPSENSKRKRHRDEESTAKGDLGAEAKKSKSEEYQSPLEKAKQNDAEKINQIRRLNKIFTWGNEVPDPFIEFSDLNLPAQLIENLQNSYNITLPTPIQMQSIPIMLEKRDLLASAPTGSGKTLAFAIPVILKSMQAIKFWENKKLHPSSRLSAIVLEPTKILARQTYDCFTKFCQNFPINCQYLEKEISNDSNILVTTPNRLIYALDTLEEANSKKLLKDLRWLVVDESDRIFDLTEGDQSFRQQLAKIIEYCSGKSTRRAFFSATFSYEVEEWCNQNLVDVAMVCIGARNSANSSVQQELVFAGWEQGKVAAVKQLIRTGFQPPALIFVQSKDRAKQLEVPEEECNSAVKRFRAGELSILVCTEILGRGLDFTNVNLVINFDLPTSIVSYIHRVGRTGRAGRSGRAITYFTESDLGIVRPIATVIHQAGFKVAEYLLKLSKVSKRDKKKMQKHARSARILILSTSGRNQKNVSKKHRRALP